MPPAKKRGAAATAKAKANATAKGGAKQQQTIVDSMNKSALRRKPRAAAKQPEDDLSESEGGEEGATDQASGGPEDEEMVSASDDDDKDEGKKKRPQRAHAQVAPTTKKRRAPARVVADDSDDSEQEEKSEERGTRQTRARSAPKPRTSGGGQTADADAVLTGSFLMMAGNSSDLSRRLKQTWAVLQQMPNQQHDADVPLEKLRLVCTELLHDKIMDHTEKNVRSLASCCFVELMRVYAPDMPFKSNEELYDAFQLVLEQLRCLAIESGDDKSSSGIATASSTNLHHVYVLESLASVKSYLLLLGMDYVPEESDDPLLVQLFRTLFNTIRKDHSVKIENLMLSIMTTCIEESDSIEQNLLDVILSPLVHAHPNVDTTSAAIDPANAESSAARGPYHLAQELIRRTSDHLQSHLSHFFNSVLVDAPTTFMNSKASELKEHVYTLIYEVHKVHSSLLLYVLPNVAMQLQVDEVATRSEAIALMGRLFASSHADYGHDYMKNFRDFLGRFRDVSKEIRLQMVQVSVIIWKRKAELAPLIEKEIVARLTDPEWEVRRLVVNEVCDLAANHIEAVSEDCLRQVGERMKDKRIVLRKEAMTGLSQVYATHISAYWAGEEEDDDSSDLSLGNAVPTSNAKKLGWVPDFVLKCFAYPQQELKLRVIQLLDDILLPKAFSETCRAKGLLFIYHSLDATAREALRRVFVERAKCQTQLEAFLSAKKMSRRASTSPSQAGVVMESATNALHSGIAPLFSDTDHLRKLLNQLASWKDQTVFKQLEILRDCSKSSQDQRNARDRLVKAIGSKSPLGDFLKNFCRKLNMLTVSEETIATYLRFFSGTGLPHHRENRSVTDLLQIVARTMPQLFASSVQNDLETILTENDESAKTNGTADKDEEDEDVEHDHKVVVSLLNALALFAEHWKKRQLASGDVLDRSATDEIPSDALKNYLKQCCLGVALKSASSQDGGAAAKFAAQILANFFGESKDVSGLVVKLCSKKILAAPSTPTSVSTLHSLHVFAKRCPLHFFRHPDSVSSLWDTLLENFIRQDKQDAKADAAKLKKGSKTGYTNAKAAEVRCLAIKVVADLLLYCHDGDTANLVGRSRELLTLLFDVLRSDGRKWGSAGSLPVKYRTSAACNILKLLRHRTIESSLAVAEWHILGFVMQDSAEDVRKAFVKKLSANLMKSSIPHPHKYLSYLVLAASEPSAVMKKHARGLLTVAVERMRRVFEATSSRRSATHSQDAGDDEEDQQNVNALMVPEYALPYVIHLLAHHPDFPASAASMHRKGGMRGSLMSDPAWSDQVAYLDFLIDGLMPANTVGADNIAFLLQILAKLSDCHDATDPNGVAIYPLVECAVQVLKRRIKNQSNLKAFPGKIYLPKQLFNSGKASDKRVSSKMSQLSIDANDDEQLESRTSAEPPVKKSRISASLSPIKPSGTLDTFLTMSSPPLSAQKRRTSTSSTTRRKAPVKSPATPVNGDDEASSATPSRRQSLMRKARSQAKMFVSDSESEEDPDSFVPRASVASRANKRDSSASAMSPATKSSDDETPGRTSPPKRGRSSMDVDEETKGGSDVEEGDDSDDDMASFRASRRRRRS